MSNLKSLEKLGLTKNQIEIYKFLLRNGSLPAPEIVNGMGMDKSSVYRALKALEDFGLVEVSGLIRNQIFHPMHPKKLEDVYKERIEEIKSTKSDIDLFIKDIDQFAKEHYKQNNIQVYEGSDGYRAWMYERLEGDHNLIQELSTTKFIKKLDKGYTDFMDEFIPKRIKKGIWVNGITFSQDEIPDEFDRSDTKKLKEYRNYPEEEETNAAFCVFGEKLGYFTTVDNKFIGIYINDRFIAHLAKRMFNVIWDSSAPI